MLANDSGCGKEVQFEISMRVEDVVVGAFQITKLYVCCGICVIRLCASEHLLSFTKQMFVSFLGFEWAPRHNDIKMSSLGQLLLLLA